MVQTDAPRIEPEENGLNHVLNQLGVHYTHRNDELMAESTIEGQRFQANLQVCTEFRADVCTVHSESVALRKRKRP